MNFCNLIGLTDAVFTGVDAYFTKQQLEWLRMHRCVIVFVF